MAISLSTLRRKERPKPPVMVVFGTGGIGKTTLAAGAPNPVLLAVEDGIGELDVPNWPIASYADMMTAIGVLYSEEHDRRSIIVDSLDWLEAHVAAETCRRNGWQNLDEPGYGKGPNASLTVWRELIEGLRALRDEREMIVIMIAHHIIKRFDSPETEPYDRYNLKLYEKAGALLYEFADVVGFLNYRVSVAKTETGFNKKVARGVGGGQRVLYFEERPGFVAKNRYGMPPSIDLPSTQDPAQLWAAVAQHLPAVSQMAEAA